MTEFTLLSSPPSPFGRKVKIAASLLGLSDRITVVAVETVVPDAELLARNPLGKIPALVPAGGAALYDSRVILEYLDHLAGGGRIIPTETGPRFAALTLQALCDGLMDAALLQVYETRLRPEGERSPGWSARQAEKVRRALATLEAAPPTAVGDPAAITVGEIALSAALGYLDLRFAGAWRAEHPALAAWLESFAAAVPAFEATRFKG
ncbi:glutathione S-transferase family protein [Methylobrevis albus]|uniref:Glutathione S-transferase family protein n=1 Tax=Methylobrevis albus TaxID=2793297 RepID=A0A931MYY7_9HYPH|nr:glutathione S-transferase family protein [Methylobrevis albus]MBH0238480.1 glutathione S-transferase family protein [Methylobrevis albus]